jgi:hypothetical protein
MTSVYDFFPDIDSNRRRECYPDLRHEPFWQVYEACKASTLINLDAMHNIWESVRSITRNQLPGAFVECGVFLGGSVMAALMFLAESGDVSREFYLYDTFEGFPENTEELDWDGGVVKFDRHPDFEGEVRGNIGHVGYPEDLLHFIRGPVESTLLDSKNLPESIAYLRLDTDYYESTRLELELLYPRLVSGGVCIVDDYGVFDGARRATEQYLDSLPVRPLLHRVNTGVRVFVKP